MLPSVPPQMSVRFFTCSSPRPGLFQLIWINSSATLPVPRRRETVAGFVFDSTISVGTIHKPVSADKAAFKFWY